MIKVKFFICNPFQELCYVVWDEDSRHCMLIDPGMCSDREWNKIVTYIHDNQLVPERVLITHSHTDHVMGVGYVKQAFPDVVVCGSMEDQNHLPSLPEQNELFGVDVPVHYAPIEKNLIEGDSFLFPAIVEGETAASEDETAASERDAKPVQHRVQVIDCPGHSHHGLCYYFPDDDVLFSGDVLFAGAVGRSDFGQAAGGNGRLLAEGIVQKLFALPANVMVYPGHGMYTTIGYEMQTNPYV